MPQPSAPTPSKVCVLCGLDCAGRPRVRDQHGKYRCEECLSGKRAPALVPAIDPDDGIIALADEPAEPDRRVAGGDTCAGCGRPMPGEAAICIGCGYNRSTGSAVRTTFTRDSGSTPVKANTCTKCGYSLAGLRTGRCPECGTVNRDPKYDRRERELRESARLARMSWVQPVVMIAMGLGVMLALAAWQGGPGGMAEYLVSFGVSLGIGLAIYMMCSAMWIGFDVPAPITALRLAGVYALADVAYTLAGLARAAMFGMFGIALFIVATLIYAGLMMKIMDIDFPDAVIVAIITTIAKIVAVLAFFSV
jgi:hypothetical protein